MDTSEQYEACRTKLEEPRELPDWSVPKMVHAIETNQVEQLSLLARTANGRLENQDDVTWFMSGIPTAAMNGVVRARLAPSGIDSQVHSIMKNFRTRRIPMTWWVGPSTQPGDLPKYLEAHGLRYAGELKGIAVDLSLPDLTPYVMPGFTMGPVDDASKVATFARIFSIGFGIKNRKAHLALTDLWQALVQAEYPHFLHYIGYLKNEPVGIVSLLFAGGVAGLYHLTAMPGTRKEGVGPAMIATALQEVRRRGFRFAVLVAKRGPAKLYEKLAVQAGVTLYEKREVLKHCTFKLYAWAPPESWFGMHLSRIKNFANRVVSI